MPQLGDRRSCRSVSGRPEKQCPAVRVELRFDGEPAVCNPAAQGHQTEEVSREPDAPYLASPETGGGESSQRGIPNNYEGTSKRCQNLPGRRPKL